VGGNADNGASPQQSLAPPFRLAEAYYGLNDIDEWMIPFFGASVYDDPAVYAKSDPMHFVKAVKTRR